MNAENIARAIRQIERWAGDAYYTPDTDPAVCPEGDEVYQALQMIKAEIDIRPVLLNGSERELIALWMDTAMDFLPAGGDEEKLMVELKGIKEKMV